LKIKELEIQISLSYFLDKTSLLEFGVVIFDNSPIEKVVIVPMFEVFEF
jgi:hypothetical protein